MLFVIFFCLVDCFFFCVAAVAALLVLLVPVVLTSRFISAVLYGELREMLYL
jgi:hypothetical protein